MPHVTIEAKITDTTLYPLLEEYAALFGKVERALFRDLHIRKLDANFLKQQYQPTYNINSRHYNSVARQLDGKVKAGMESLKLRIYTLKGQITATEETIATWEKQLAKLSKPKKSKSRSKSSATNKPDQGQSQGRGKAKRQPATITPNPVPPTPNYANLERTEKISLRFKLHNKKRRLTALKHKLEECGRQYDSKVPSICFGSGKLFRAQFHLKENGFNSLDEWRVAWRRARSNQFYCLGSKGEVGGNDNASLRVRDGKITHLRLNIPKAIRQSLAVLPADLVASRNSEFEQYGWAGVSAGLDEDEHEDDEPTPTPAPVKKGKGKGKGNGKKQPGKAAKTNNTGEVPNRDNERKYLLVKGLSFPYGGEALLTAFAAGQALSYRFIRRKEKSRTGKTLTGQDVWYVQVSFDRVPPPPTTSREIGAIGLDFNPGLVALARVDRFGNPVDRKHYHLQLQKRSTHQVKATLGDTVAAIVAEARQHDMPIVIEKLDFSEKKTALREQSPRYARMLSSFAYSKFNEMIHSRAAREGVEVFEVNPAFTSVLGLVKFKTGYGLSTHAAAAVAIARRSPHWARPSTNPNVRLSAKAKAEEAAKAEAKLSQWKGKGKGKGPAKVTTTKAEHERGNDNNNYYCGLGETLSARGKALGKVGQPSSTVSTTPDAALVLPVRNRTKHVWSDWRVVSQRLGVLKRSLFTTPGRPSSEDLALRRKSTPISPVPGVNRRVRLSSETLASFNELGYALWL